LENKKTLYLLKTFLFYHKNSRSFA